MYMFETRVKFKLDAAALNQALETVSIVPPSPCVPGGGSGYLFIVRKDADDKDRCYIHTRDAMRVARADFEVSDVEAYGSFIFPSEHISCFKFAEGLVTFTASQDGVGEKAVHKVSYDFGSGAGGERSTYSPELMIECDKALNEAIGDREYSAAILKEALNMGKSFAAPSNNGRGDEHYKTVQVFDSTVESKAKADGTLFAANATQSFWFYCDSFRGKPLAIHGNHLGALNSFLSKSSGNVTIRASGAYTFAINSLGRVLGWTAHTKLHQKFTYYPTTRDQIVATVPKQRVLTQLKYIQSELQKGSDKIKVTLNLAESTMRFGVVDSSSKALSYPIDVSVVQAEGTGFSAKEFVNHVNINHLQALFDGAKADRVEFRICIVPAGDNRPKDTALFRTIDEFWMDGEGKVVAGSGVPEGKEPEGASKCVVTRFMPGKD